MATPESWAFCREQLIKIIGVNRFKKTALLWEGAIYSVMNRDNCNLIDAVQILENRADLSLQQIVVIKAVAAEMTLKNN
ncbi:hypothetical protein [Rheinheimera hassiensis]|uniref:hypothetical protein n=1 Tax=Rheinheimera hassiensis TaxID=1193627 RepID=UPI001F05161B|nr:hypothetical protein [Rheinheimera hassiensis]